MSWIRSAMSRAVEAGGSVQLSSAVRSYKDTVVHKAGQAVAGGAKIFQDRIGVRNFQSYKLAVKRLEEVSVTCRGIERVQLLRRWLVALKEIERLDGALKTEHLDLSIESNDSPTKPTLILYYDHDLGGEPMNFRDVFLHSQALEGITLSLILEKPNDEEISLLLEIFGLCLMGGKEAHNATVNNIRDLAKTFSNYDDEVLAKREELLQHAQEAIAGLKNNAVLVRIDSEVSSIHHKLHGKQLPLSYNKSSEVANEMSTESLQSPEEEVEQIKLCSRLEELLLWKKVLKIRDSPIAHNQKVDKLKVLSESLVSSASKAEKRISDNRTQKEEALKFRVTKSSEVSLLEKELVSEIEALERQKDKLEGELKKVITSLTSAHGRLQNTREERDQFDEASNQILQHFKLKEDELSRAIASYRAEAEVCDTFVQFLETSWAFQSSYAEHKDKLVNEELKTHEEYFANLAISLLSAYKEELGASIPSIRELVENFKLVEKLNSGARLDAPASIQEKTDVADPRRRLEEQYQTIETKFLTAFSVVENIKQRLPTQDNKISRKSDARIKELLDALELIKQEFESIERPKFEINTSLISVETPSKVKASRIPFLSPRQPPQDKPEPLGRKSLDAEEQLSKLKLELELEDHGLDNSMDGICDWEFDDKIEKESRKSVQESNKI
ncbi:uncharacterized protein LOC142529758 isoform X1 [Primulina tabacum]|uniref:uncharacterized protein LOC142529758 isoform X1 n=1 Tax=Primulina tabacum TaxID=48773 RepID=UPI003F5A9CE2